MKKTLMLSLVTVLALGVAGITWAAYPAADEAAAPAAKALVAEDAPSAIETFEVENAALAADLDALFEAPVQVANCCLADCYEERAACWDACVGHPDYSACRDQCSAEYDACRAFCF